MGVALEPDCAANEGRVLKGEPDLRYDGPRSRRRRPSCRTISMLPIHPLELVEVEVRGAVVDHHEPPHLGHAGIARRFDAIAASSSSIVIFDTTLTLQARAPRMPRSGRPRQVTGRTPGTAWQEQEWNAAASWPTFQSSSGAPGVSILVRAPSTSLTTAVSAARARR